MAYDSPDTKDTYHRWQAALREQLSYAVNLFLTFATAFLGYSLVLLRDDKFVPVGWARRLFWIGAIVLSVSVFTGLGCVVTRLNDFRGAARNAGQKDLYFPILGKTTWFLFYVQFGSFAVGGITLGLSLLLTYARRLF
jgi:hypothetical protein